MLCHLAGLENARGHLRSTGRKLDFTCGAGDNTGSKVKQVLKKGAGHTPGRRALTFRVLRPWLGSWVLCKSPSKEVLASVGQGCLWKPHFLSPLLHKLPQQKGLEGPSRLSRPHFMTVQKQHRLPRCPSTDQLHLMAPHPLEAEGWELLKSGVTRGYTVKPCLQIKQ